MKDFATDEKQMFLAAQAYWEEIEKRKGFVTSFLQKIAELGFLAVTIIIALFLLVQ